MPRTQSTRSLLAGGALSLVAALALAAPASADNGVTIFAMDAPNDYQPFQEAMDERGYHYIANETFDEFGGFDDPFPSESFTIQSNRQPGGEAGPDPVGDNALSVTGAANEAGPATPQLRTPEGGASLDVVVDAQYQALRVTTKQTSEVRVFDTEGDLLDSRTLAGTDIFAFGAGIVADENVEIGRVNITQLGSSDEVTQAVVGFGTGTPVDDEGDPADTPGETQPETPPTSGGGGGLLGGGLLGDSCVLFC